MLFNSDIFLFGFMPCVLLGFFVLKRFSGPRSAQIWLTLASFAFYAWSGPRFLPHLIFSIVFNYVLGRELALRSARAAPVRVLLAFGVTVNLLLLAYFKYGGLITDILASAGYSLDMTGIELPVGISFYTFTQIAFLVDAARNRAHEYDASRYGLFVTFFPHLIAGPIIHHKEMMPQFALERIRAVALEHFPLALTLFVIGLFKKVVLADSFATYASLTFNAAASGGRPDLIAAWTGAFCYAFQLYFDFSGYSDMAMGLALMFGIRLPVNFLSPYQSESIIEFWRRWHITLSRFLRDYLYFALGGNRRGPVRRYANLIIVMLLGGLWHGAGWNFLLWGGLHGLYLVVNHLWEFATITRERLRLGFWPARCVTFLSVVIAWVLFRATSLHAAAEVYSGMLGLNGVRVPAVLMNALNHPDGIHVLGLHIVPLVSRQPERAMAVALCILGLVLTWAFPNSMTITAFAKPDAQAPHWWRSLAWRATPLIAFLTGVMLFWSLRNINAGAASEFIYFQF